MLNGWFTIVAQAINFLILVWLLKRFLYKPILQAIDAREKGIAAQLAAVVAKEAAAQKKSDDFQHKNEAFEKERAVLLTKATDEAKGERQRLLDQAKQDAEASRDKRQAALQTEQQHLNQDIVRWAQEQVFAIARKTLVDLSDTGLEQRMGDVFVGRVRSLTGAAKEQLATAFKSSNHTVSVHSAFDMPPAQQAAIESAVKETFAPDAHVQFETAPEMISGVELSTNGHKVAWSIADYLSTLETSAGELVHDATKPEPKPVAKSKSGPRVEAKPELKTASASEAIAGAKPGPKRESKPAPEPASSFPNGHQ
jgi:F-type H+-transporting ATPase subunit b